MQTVGCQPSTGSLQACHAGRISEQGSTWDQAVKMGRARCCMDASATAGLQYMQLASALSRATLRPLLSAVCSLQHSAGLSRVTGREQQWA